MGALALQTNTSGASNVAIGDSALVNQGSGSFNTVVGDNAGPDLTSGDDNIYIGATAGSGVISESGTIRIGDPTFVSACFVAGIVGNTESTPVCIDASTGQLGECGAGAAPASPKAPGSTRELLKQRQAMQQLKTTTEKQAATIALQERQIQTLTVALKQQAEQIQKVSAQLQMIRPAPRVVGNQ